MRTTCGATFSGGGKCDKLDKHMSTYYMHTSHKQLNTAARHASTYIYECSSMSVFFGSSVCLPCCRADANLSILRKEPVEQLGPS
jgi:hypothetical protein